MSELEILERRIVLKYQLLSLINEEIAEMESKRREMQIVELKEKRAILARLNQE